VGSYAAEFLVKRTRKVKRLQAHQVPKNPYQKNLKRNEKAADLIAIGEATIRKINEWDSNLIQRDQKTFQDVINFPNKLNAELANLANRAGGHDPRLTAGMKERKHDLLSELAELKEQMERIIDEDIGNYNDQYDELDLPALILPND